MNEVALKVVEIAVQFGQLSIFVFVLFRGGRVLGTIETTLKAACSEIQALKKTKQDVTVCDERLERLLKERK